VCVCVAGSVRVCACVCVVCMCVCGGGGEGGVQTHTLSLTHTTRQRTPPHNTSAHIPDFTDSLQHILTHVIEDAVLGFRV